MTQPPARPAAAQLPVELSDEVAEGTYSNLMFVTHSTCEFVLDFARALPGGRKGKVYSRVVMTPQHAKALWDLLTRNVAMFEETHGAIRLPGRPADDARIGFAPATSVNPSEGPPPGTTSDAP
jgi:hypothetical protein